MVQYGAETQYSLHIGLTGHGYQAANDGLWAKKNPGRARPAGVLEICPQRIAADQYLLIFSGHVERAGVGSRRLVGAERNRAAYINRCDRRRVERDAVGRQG